MTKADIIESIHSRTGFSKADSTTLLNQLLTSCVEILQKEKILKIRGFATFKVIRKKSRIGRNPKTKENVLITARNVISFNTSDNFKKTINETRNCKEN